MPYVFKDPSSLLRPWPNQDLQFFAEELYALLTSYNAEDIVDAVPGQRRPGPKEITQRLVEAANKPATPSPRQERIEALRAATEAPAGFQGASAPSTPRTPPSPSPSPTAAPGGPTMASQPSTPREAAPASPGEQKVEPESNSQAVTPRATTVGAEVASKVNKYVPTIKELLDIGNFANVPGGGGDTNTFMGKVSGGTGDTYDVYLYQSGPKGEADQDTVKVFIPQIDPDEKIPADTWLTGIMSFVDSDGNTVYACQPPVWLA